MIVAQLRAKGPYSLRVSGRHASDACRVVRDGTFRSTIRAEHGLERVQAVQHADGTIVVRAESEAAVEQVRWILGLDDDHSEFVREFGRDPLLGATLKRIRGLRPMRTGTVAQSLLRAVAGQLIQAKRAREIERAVVRAASPSLDELGRFSPAELARYGLGARRAGALVRLCRAVELERLKGLATRAAAARLERERGLGPWSVGVVCLEGLGRYERGLARDLGLIKLASALAGRWVEAEETDALLTRYGEWGGLASVYLLAGYAQGLVPLRGALAA